VVRIIVKRQQFEDPGLVKQVFGNPVFGFAWFFLRLYVGLQWLAAGLHKVVGETAVGWTRDGYVTQNGQRVFKHAGDSILASWQSAIGKDATSSRITFEWYRDVLQFMVDHRWNGWFTYVIAYGEVLVGLGLILGCLTGFAALFGATMNMNFMLAGTTSINPVLFMASVLLLLAWKTAGYVGLDRWVLPLLGTPWHPGRLFHRGQGPRAAGQKATVSAGQG
jgi:thiosulfate dehydrogenase [quinone] large subunit